MMKYFDDNRAKRLFSKLRRKFKEKAKKELLKQIKNSKRLAYENWKLGKITKEKFLSSSNDFENKFEKCQSDIEKYEQKIKNALNEVKCEEYWIEHFRRNKKINI